MGEGEGLGSNKIQLSRVGDGECLVIRPCQNLNATGQLGSSFHLSGDDGKSSHDLWSNRALEVRRVVHIFNEDSVDSRFFINGSFNESLSFELLHGALVGRSARKCTHVNHGDDRFLVGKPDGWRRRDFHGLLTAS